MENNTHDLTSQLDHHDKEQRRQRNIKYRQSIREQCINISKRNTSVTDTKFTTDQRNIVSFDDFLEPFFIIAVVIINEDFDEESTEAIVDEQQSGAPSNDIYNSRYSTLNEDNHIFTTDLESNTELDNDYYLLESPPSQASGSESESDTDENEELIQIIDFIRGANLDKSNTDRLLDLLNNIHSNVGLPKTGRELWERAGIKFTFKTNIYCSICNRQLTKFADKCNCLHGNQNMNTELILFSIPDEIRRVVKLNFNLIEFFADYRHEFMYDITNGDIYKSNEKKNSITLLLGTDGKPTFRSSSSSMWPVFCTIAEIPPPVREYQRNVMLFALYHSTKSPTAEMLFGNIVKTIKRLQTSGLLINLGKKDEYQSLFKNAFRDQIISK
ncbi:unnamed protein product [Rotaria sp. Silwood2]|nr:unnamed protein product [Rotaria sp. Silwood2]CAF4562732.1 unnamed protein product [Rotaria sp. Silwood2]